MPVFETGAFNHSATPPLKIVLKYLKIHFTLSLRLFQQFYHLLVGNLREIKIVGHDGAKVV